AHRLAVFTGPEHQVQVTAAETVDDAPVGFVQRGVLRVDRPGAVERPLVGGECIGCVVVPAVVVRDLPAGEAFAARITDIGFRRAAHVAGAGGFGTGCAGLHVAAGQILVAGVAQQAADHIFAAGVVAFAE